MAKIHRRPDTPAGADAKKVFFAGAVRNLLFFFVLIALLFVSAGRLGYRQGWLLTALMAAQVVVILIQAYRDTSLTGERMKPGPGTKAWDKVFVALYFPTSTAILVVSSLDAGRFGWSPEFPIWVYPIAAAVFVAGFSFTRWAMQKNRWFSSVVRIQDDRGQQVVRDGPYRFMRHPGYVGIIASDASAPFILGSLWGLVPAGIVVLLLVIRTALEDAALKKELFGYTEYAEEVQYRLLPGVW